jgi:hypothetical protein
MRTFVSTGPIGQVPFGEPWQLPGGIGGGVLGQFSGSLNATPTDYGVMALNWTLPSGAEDIDRFAVVRAGFGHPASRYAGVTVVEAAVGDPIRSANDAGLFPGRWYYYSLFVRDPVSERWVRAANATQIAVKDWGHHYEMWNALPYFYRTMDQKLHGTVAQGPLYRFLKIFSFEFDTLRSMANGLQQMRSIQDVSSRMLESFSTDFGLDYERTLGDVKMRGILSNVLNWRKDKGTQGTLQDIVRVVSACADAEVATVPNILLDHNDSGWDEPTLGRWISVDNATVARRTAAPVPPPDSTAYLSATAVAAGDMVLSNSSLADIRKHGIKVTPGSPYVASIYARSATTDRNVRLDIEWYDASGSLVANVPAANTNVVGPIGQVVYGEVNPTGPYGPDGEFYGTVLSELAGLDADDDWVRRYIVRAAPTDARFARMLVIIEDAVLGEVHYVGQAQFEQGFQPTTWEPARKVNIYTCGGRVNKATNPSFEISTTDGWTAINTAMTADTVTFRFGSRSLRISPTVGGTAAGASTVVDDIEPGRFYTFSCYAMPSVECTASLSVDWLDDANNVLANDVTLRLLQDDGEWKRPWITGTGPEGTTKARFTITTVVAGGATLNIEGVLVEQGIVVQDYFDGSFLGTDYFWAGDPHDSTSLYLADRDVYESVLARYLDEYVPASTPWEIFYLA